MSLLAVSYNAKKGCFIDKELPIIKTPKKIFQAEILIGGTEIIEQVFDEWARLCEEGACNEPFFRHEWFACFIKNFEKEIIILTVRRGGKLRAVLPFVKKPGKLHGVPARKLQGVFNPNTPRFDLIHGSDESERSEIIEAVWKEIKKLSSWDAAEFRLVKIDSWLNDLLTLARSENYRAGIWEMEGAPFVTLPQGDDKEKLIEDYFRSLSKNRRQVLGKKLRRLEKLGKVEFVLTRGYSPELIQKYFELEAKSWKSRAGTDVAADPKAARLHDDFARAAAEKNALFIHELNLDGKTIAMYISIMYDSQTIGWKMSFDEEYGDFSPGNLLFREVLNNCIRNDSPEIDQLSPATSNKKLWASGEREHAAFYIFQPGVFGSLLWKWKFSVISRLRKIKNK